jgi:plasmid stabilization system protein ParE
MKELNVFITRRADKDENRIYEYISKEFGEIYAIAFREKLLHLFHTLSKHPLIGRPAKNDASLRVIIFAVQNKIVYKVPKQILLSFEY